MRFTDIKQFGSTPNKETTRTAKELVDSTDVSDDDKKRICNRRWSKEEKRKRRTT